MSFLEKELKKYKRKVVKGLSLTNEIFHILKYLRIIHSLSFKSGDWFNLLFLLNLALKTISSFLFEEKTRLRKLLD